MGQATCQLLDFSIHLLPMSMLGDLSRRRSEHRPVPEPWRCVAVTARQKASPPAAALGRHRGRVNSPPARFINRDALRLAPPSRLAGPPVSSTILLLPHFGGTTTFFASERDGMRRFAKGQESAKLLSEQGFQGFSACSGRFFGSGRSLVRIQSPRIVQKLKPWGNGLESSLLHRLDMTTRTLRMMYTIALASTARITPPVYFDTAMPTPTTKEYSSTFRMNARLAAVRQVIGDGRWRLA